VTVTDRPATVAVADRAVDWEDAAAVRVTEPEPLPLAGLTEIQAAPLEVVQAQPAVVVTVSVALPPAFGRATVVGETV